MKFPIAVTLLLSLFVFRLSVAQHAGYQHYSVEDGLVQSEVTTLHQDPKGFLWIGTKNGISRFDGHSFQTIRDTAGVSESWVKSIMDLNDSVVWFLTARGCLLYTYRERSTTITSYPLDCYYGGFWSREGKGFFMTITPTSRTYYQVDQNGLKQIENPVLDRIADFFHECGWIQLTYSPRDGNYYFRTRDNKLGCLRGDKVIVLNVPSLGMIMTGEDQRIYFSTPGLDLDRNRLNKKIRDRMDINGGMKQPERVYCVTDTTIQLVADFGMNLDMQAMNLLIKNKDTLFLSSNKVPFIRQYVNGKLTEYVLPFPAANGMLLDSESNLWLGSPMGLVRLHPFSFTYLDETDGLNKNIQLVAEDKNRNIIAGGYERGIQRIENCRIHTVPMPLSYDSRIRWYIYPGSMKDRTGNVLMSLNPYCMMAWDGKKLQDIPGMPVSASFSFFEDTLARTLYCGTDYGLLKVKEGIPAYKLIDVTPGNKTNRVVSILMDPTGRMLLGGFKGLSFLKDGVVTHLPTREFPYNQGANAMVKDHRGNIWIGNSQGLWLFDMKKFRRIRNSWFNDLVVSLCTIDSSKLFIGGLHGIGFLDLGTFYGKDTVMIRYFNAGNGFSGKECQQNAVCYDSHGLLWVATTDKLQRIDPGNLPLPMAGPRVYIEKISLLDETMKMVPLVVSSVSGGRLEVFHDENDLRFDFTSPVFRGASFVMFRYRLEGQDERWSQPTRERYAVYTNLSPGKYVFQVTACNDSGIWSALPASYEIIIRPAFWQTWWFLTVLVMILAGFFFWLGLLVMARRKRLLQEKLESEKKIAELQLISIRNQIDPHFTFNAMNSIASVILKEEKEKAYRFFVKLSNLIRQVLTSGDKLTRTLAEELLFVQNYLEIEKLRFRDSFQFVIDIVQPVSLDQEVPKMVIQTYAENALKHGLLNKNDGPGLLTIRIREEGGNLHITVEDNGVGREKARQLGQDSTGKGMMILNFYYDFFDRYNDQKILHSITDMYNEHDEPTGTRVTVIIPAGFDYNITAHEKK